MDDSPDLLSEESDSDSDNAGSLSDDEDSATSMSDDESDCDDSDFLLFGEDDGNGGVSAINRIPAEADVSLAKKQMNSIPALAGSDTSLSARDIITLHALSTVLQSGQHKMSDARAAVHLVHLVILRYCKLAQRSVAIAGKRLGAHHDAFMRDFTSSASCALRGWFDGEFASAPWDAFDLFDGRVYRYVASRYTSLTLPEPVHGDVTRLAKILESLSGVDITGQLPARQDTQGGEAEASSKKQQRTSALGSGISPVLPFSHPVLDPFLRQIHVQTAEVSELPAGSKIFQELTHWHNVKKPLDPKFIPKPPGFFARKRNQKFMADTIAYSASLTGSSGKTIDPEIIVVQAQATEKKPKPSASSGQDWKAALKEKAGAKGKAPVNKKQPAKSGKQKALEAAEALKAGKTQEKSVAVIAFWAKRCMEFEKESSLSRRYAKAQKYLLDVSAEHATAVGSEVSLYLCHVLALLRASKNVSQRSSKRSLLSPCSTYPADISP